MFYEQRKCQLYNHMFRTGFPDDPSTRIFLWRSCKKKNVLNTMFATMFIAGTAIVMWILFGYSLSFGSDVGGVIGGFDFLGFNNVSISESTRGLEIPDALFAGFQ